MKRESKQKNKLKMKILFKYLFCIDFEKKNAIKMSKLENFLLFILSLEIIP